MTDAAASPRVPLRLLGLVACAGALTGGTSDCVTHSIPAAGGAAAAGAPPTNSQAQRSPALSARSPSTATRFSWPEGAMAAVSLTYDDAIATDLDVAGPALARHSLHGTFFLTGSSPEIAKRTDAWRALGHAGQELASHTMHHPCDRSKDWVKKGYALEDYDLERMARELDESIALLRALGADRGPYTFAYPCGLTWVGEDHTSYAPLVERLFLASRGVAAAIADPRTDPLSDVPAIMGNDKTGGALIDIVRQAVDRSGWLVLVFHGVGGDYLTVDAQAHDELLAYLADNRQTVWTDTFGAVARYVAGARSVR